MTTTEHSHQVLAELGGQGRALRQLLPEVYAGFVQMDRAAMGDGAVSARVKQLIALAIAVTRECDGCIASHARSAVRAGVTREEVAEAMGVAIVLNGGPGTVWGPRALAAFDEFATGDASPSGGAATTGEAATPGNAASTAG